MNPQHFQIRPRVDRNSKKAQCICGWAGPWRSTPRTGHRYRDALKRRQLIRKDFEAHLVHNRTS